MVFAGEKNKASIIKPPRPQTRRRTPFFCPFVAHPRVTCASPVHQLRAIFAALQHNFHSMIPYYENRYRHLKNNEFAGRIFSHWFIDW
jgi:hypothetical protein